MFDTAAVSQDRTLGLCKVGPAQNRAPTNPNKHNTDEIKFKTKGDGLQSGLELHSNSRQAQTA